MPAAVLLVYPGAPTVMNVLSRGPLNMKLFAQDLDLLPEILSMGNPSTKVGEGIAEVWKSSDVQICLVTDSFELRRIHYSPQSDSRSP